MKLSLILVCPDGYESRRRAISCLTNQTARAQLELVLIVPAGVPFKPDPVQLAALGGYRVLEIPAIEFQGQAFAVGVHAAAAPLVGIVEEHSFVRPAWAEILIRAHAEPYAAVGGAIDNANPETLCSWANLFEEFGPLVPPVATGEATYLGGHQTTYKRELLIQYGEALPKLLDNETALHRDLRRRGHKLFLAGDAISDHVNISSVRGYWRQAFLGQRGFAAARATAERWSFSKRLLYILAAPLLPLVRLRRILYQIRRAKRDKQLMPQILFLLLPGLICGTVGETLGYLLGDSPANARIKAEAELDRARFLRTRER